MPFLKMCFKTLQTSNGIWTNIIKKYNQTNMIIIKSNLKRVQLIKNQLLFNVNKITPFQNKKYNASRTIINLKKIHGGFLQLYHGVDQILFRKIKQLIFNNHNAKCKKKCRLLNNSKEKKFYFLELLNIIAMLSSPLRK
jgi:hypothetical protein